MVNIELNSPNLKLICNGEGFPFWLGNSKSGGKSLEMFLIFTFKL